MKKFLFILSMLASMLVIYTLQLSKVFDYFSTNQVDNILGMIMTTISVYCVLYFFFLKHIRKDKKEKLGFVVNAPFHLYPDGNMLLIEGGKPANRPTNVILVNKNYKTLNNSPFDIVYKIFDDIYSVKNKNLRSGCGLITDKVEYLTKQDYKSISMIDNKMLKLQIADCNGYRVFSRKTRKLLSQEIFSIYVIYTIENTSNKKQHKIYCFRNVNNLWSMYNESGIHIKSYPLIESQLIHVRD